MPFAFRSSYASVRPGITNFGKRALELIFASVPLIPKFASGVPHNPANFGIGTLGRRRDDSCLTGIPRATKNKSAAFATGNGFSGAKVWTKAVASGVYQSLGPMAPLFEKDIYR